MGQKPQSILLVAKYSADAQGNTYTRFERTFGVGGGKSVTISVDGNAIEPSAVVPCKDSKGKETMGVWVSAWFNYGNRSGYQRSGYRSSYSSYGRTGYRRSSYRRSY
jgi:hypothetical protein